MYLLVLLCVSLYMYFYMRGYAYCTARLCHCVCVCVCVCVFIVGYRCLWAVHVRCTYHNTVHHAHTAGDRIAIIASGSLLCCGSFEYLRNRFGRGHHLVLVRSSAEAQPAPPITHDDCIGQDGPNTAIDHTVEHISHTDHVELTAPVKLEAGAGPNDPAVGPNDPAVGPNDPAVGPNGPAVGPNDPAVGPNGPAVGPNGPAVAGTLQDVATPYVVAPPPVHTNTSTPPSDGSVTSFIKASFMLLIRAEYNCIQRLMGLLTTCTWKSQIPNMPSLELGNGIF